MCIYVCMCVNICVCMCMYMCMCIIICVHICVQLRIYIHTYIYIHTHMYICVCVYVYCVVYVYVCMCTYMCAFTHICMHILCVNTYIYVLNIPIFCAVWLRKCDFLTEKLGIKFIPDPDYPDPKWFIPDPTPDPAKSSGSDRIRIHNTDHRCCFTKDPVFNMCTMMIYVPSKNNPKCNVPCMYSDVWKTNKLIWLDSTRIDSTRLASIQFDWFIWFEKSMDSLKIKVKTDLNNQVK